MNNKGTEFTIFQGAPSIHVDNQVRTHPWKQLLSINYRFGLCFQRIEEEEARQDQLRRNAEVISHTCLRIIDSTPDPTFQLHNELQNAFADLHDDDEDHETMNSTRLSNGDSMHNHSNTNHHYQPQQPFPLRNQETHLKNLLETKERELDYVSSQLASERQQKKATIDEYEKRLAIAEAEKERALMTRDQTHELLVDHKSKAIEHQDVNQKLCSKIKSLETENSKMVAELETTKLMLSDVQMKYNMVEKNVIFNADRNTDKILKQAQERHSAQVAMMQQQLDSLKTKYDDLEHEHKKIEIRYKELQRSREAIMIEKSEVVNELNKNLEEAQRQCQDLLSRPDLSHDNRQLQSIVRNLESQKEDMSRTIGKLQHRLQEQANEMETMDSIIQECGGNNFSFSESTKFIHRDPLKNKNSSTPIAPEARLARVKDELCKSLNNIKNKREEIRICEQQLREKDEEIKQLKADENKALVQMNQFRDESIRLESKVKILENELEKVRLESATHSCVTNEVYEGKIKALQQQKEALEAELDSIKKDYERLVMKNGELVEKETEWLDRIHQLESELETLQDPSKFADSLRHNRERVQLLEEELERLQIRDDPSEQEILDRFDGELQAQFYTDTLLTFMVSRWNETKQGQWRVPEMRRESPQTWQGEIEKVPLW